MARKVSEIALELADREAIRDCLLRYPRSLDRLDRAVGAEFHWPGATDNHAGLFEGKFEDLLDMAQEALAKMDQTQHFLGNMLIEINGNEARSETYVVAYHGLNEGGVKSTFIAGARYLDVLQKREDEWRVSSRVLLIDWMKNIPEDPAWQQDLLGHVATGGRKPDDWSTGHFKSIGLAL